MLRLQARSLSLFKVSQLAFVSTVVVVVVVERSRDVLRFVNLSNRRAALSLPEQSEDLRHHHSLVEAGRRRMPVPVSQPTLELLDLQSVGYFRQARAAK